MSRVSRLVKLVPHRPDLFITGTLHRRLLFTTPKPNTLLKWRQISVSAISSDGRLFQVLTEEGEERPRNSGVDYLDREKKRTLPEELLRNVVVLTCESVDGGTCDVYLVGTNHVSQESSREVQAVISHLRPEVPTTSEMVDQWKKKHNLFGILYGYALASVADELGAVPGSEFRVGYEEAKKWGSKVILGDRPASVTLGRMWGKMSLWHKTKLLSFCLFGATYKMPLEMNDDDMASVIQKVRKHFPALMETLVDERDQYVSSTLLRVASQHHSVVAVVGKAHLQGIKKYWMQPVEMEKLMEIPSANTTISTRKIVKSLGVAAVGVAIVAGVYLAAGK